VLDFLAAVVPVVKAFDGSFTAKAIGNALYGLQGLNSVHHVVQELVAGLIPKVTSN
jgi:hypothetical protein